MPFGDLQKGTKGFREDLWEQWLQEAHRDKHAYFIGMGDYSDTFRPTIRKNISKVTKEDASAHQQLDYALEKGMQKFAEDLMPLRDRIIGLHSGHHNWDLLGGMNTDQYLCQLLKVKWLGFEGWTRLSVERSRYHHPTVDIFSTHGCGGAGFTGTDMTALERRIMPYRKAHIYLRGHSTKIYSAPAPPLEYIRNMQGKMKIGRMPRVLCNTGGFMEGRIEGETSYVEEKNMPPVALGWITIDINFHRNPKYHPDEPIEIRTTNFAP